MLPQYSQYLQFHLFGVFTEALDRTKEENEQFRGLYFRFDYMAGSITLQVDRKDYENAPAVGSPLWLDGVLRTSSTQRINPQIIEFKPAEQMPSIEDLQLGGSVIGPAGLFRQTFVVDGEARYKCRVTSFGFFREINITQEVYHALPAMPNQIHLLHGRLTPSREYNKEYGFRTAFDLSIERLEPFESQRQRRPRPATAPAE